MNYEITPTSADFEYFLNKDRAETERIVSAMTSIIDANENKLSAMQNQTWFQRIWLTVSGKNKATLKEMEQNRDKLVSYSVQVFYKMLENKRVSDAIIANLVVRLNEVYSSHLQLQDIMYEIINKLDSKINSVDNYHNLITDIQNNKYKPEEIFLSLLKILSLFDKRIISNENYLVRIKETMEKNGFDFSQTVNICEFTEQIISLPEEAVGQIYLFAQNYTEYKFIQFACCLIEQYHFEPKSNRKIIKANAIKISLAICRLSGNEQCNIDEFYDDIKNSAIDKIKMLKAPPAPKVSPKQTQIPNPNDKPKQSTYSSNYSSKEPEKKNCEYKSNKKEKTNFEKNLEKEFEKQKKDIQKPNLMVVGGTGAGKSSLINRIFGNNIAPVGSGFPITKGIIKYESEKHPIVFFDTEGYETSNGNKDNKTNFDNLIKPKIKEMNSSELKNRIHLVWYCLPISKHRVTDYDIDNIKWFKKLNMKIAIVFTQCDVDSELENGKGEEASGYKKIIEKAGIPGLKYFETCAAKEDVPLDLEDLMQWSIEELPNEQLKKSFIAAQKVSIKSKRKLAYKIVTGTTTSVTLSAGLNPLPLTDTLLIIPQQLAMSVALSKIFMFDSIYETAGNILKTQLAGIAGRQLAASFLKFIPLVGQAVNAFVAGAITYGLGMALIEAYSSAYERFLDTGELPDWTMIFSSDVFTNNIISYFKEFKSNKGEI